MVQPAKISSNALISLRFEEQDRIRQERQIHNNSFLNLTDVALPFVNVKFSGFVEGQYIGYIGGQAISDVFLQSEPTQSVIM